MLRFVVNLAFVAVAGYLASQLLGSTISLWTACLLATLAFGGALYGKTPFGDLERTPAP